MIPDWASRPISLSSLPSHQKNQGKFTFGQYCVSYLITTPISSKAHSTNSLTLCISPVAITKSSGFCCWRIKYIAWRREEIENAQNRNFSEFSHINVFLGMSPIAFGIQIAQFHEFLLSQANFGPSDLAGDEGGTWRWKGMRLSPLDLSSNSPLLGLSWLNKMPLQANML